MYVLSIYAPDCCWTLERCSAWTSNLDLSGSSIGSTIRARKCRATQFELIFAMEICRVLGTHQRWGSEIWFIFMCAHFFWLSLRLRTFLRWRTILQFILNKKTWQLYQCPNVSLGHGAFGLVDITTALAQTYKIYQFEFSEIFNCRLERTRKGFGEDNNETKIVSIISFGYHMIWVAAAFSCKKGTQFPNPVMPRTRVWYSAPWLFAFVTPIGAKAI